MTPEDQARQRIDEMLTASGWILTERRQNWLGRGQYKEPAAPDTTKLGPLPEGWTWASADQISSHVTDGEDIQPPYASEGYPILSGKHVRDGFVIYTDVPLISEKDFQLCPPTSSAPPGSASPSSKRHSPVICAHDFFRFRCRTSTRRCATSRSSRGPRKRRMA